MQCDELKKRIASLDEHFQKKQDESDDILPDEEYRKYGTELRQLEERLTSMTSDYLSATLATVELRCFCQVRHKDVYCSIDPAQSVIFCDDQQKAEEEAGDFAAYVAEEQRQEKSQKQAPDQNQPSKDPRIAMGAKPR